MCIFYRILDYCSCLPRISKTFYKKQLFSRKISNEKVYKSAVVRLGTHCIQLLKLNFILKSFYFMTYRWSVFFSMPINLVSMSIWILQCIEIERSYYILFKLKKLKIYFTPRKRHRDQKLKMFVLPFWQCLIIIYLYFQNGYG